MQHKVDISILVFSSVPHRCFGRFSTAASNCWYQFPGSQAPSPSKHTGTIWWTSLSQEWRFYTEMWVLDLEELKYRCNFHSVILSRKCTNLQLARRNGQVRVVVSKIPAAKYDIANMLGVLNPQLKLSQRASLCKPLWSETRKSQAYSMQTSQPLFRFIKACRLSKEPNFNPFRMEKGLEKDAKEKLKLWTLHEEDKLEIHFSAWQVWPFCLDIWNQAMNKYVTW